MMAMILATNLLLGAAGCDACSLVANDPAGAAVRTGSRERISEIDRRIRELKFSQPPPMAVALSAVGFVATVALPVAGIYAFGIAGLVIAPFAVIPGLALAVVGIVMSTNHQAGVDKELKALRQDRKRLVAETAPPIALTFAF